MPEESRTVMTGKQDRLAPALAALARLDELAEKKDTIENEALERKRLEESLGLCDRALRIFRTENKTWLTAWTLMHKASLLTELAQHVDSAVRTVHTRSALELTRKALQNVEENPAPDLKQSGTLYTGALDILFRIRSLMEEPSEIKAIEDLIRQLAGRMGEIHALDLALRSEAYDLLFTAQMLDSMITLENDPAGQQEMRGKSRELALQAYDRLRISSPSSMDPLLDFLEEQRIPAHKAASLPALCARCGTENSPGASFCSQCGATLARSFVVEHKQPSSVCRRCAHINREEAVFCTYCGARLRQED